MPHPHCYSQIFDWLSRAIRKQTIKVSVPTLEQRIGADAALDSLELMPHPHCCGRKRFVNTFSQDRRAKKELEDG